MRAKMSERQARIRRLMDGGFHRRARLALAEARAILAESEPRREAYGPAGFEERTGFRPCDLLGYSDAGAALAARLAWFDTLSVAEMAGE